MAVLLVNAQLGVRIHTDAATDAHGFRGPPSWAPRGPVLPGRRREATGPAEGASWHLALDPSLWPVRERDLVVEPATGMEWLVSTADLITNNADSAVDYIRVLAYQRTPDRADTEPGGARFAGN